MNCYEYCVIPNHSCVNNAAIIGLDGASWNILGWLIKEGCMPNLKTLIDEGVRGHLRSTIPPVTGAAWLAVATGLNPGKTGVIDFFKNVGDFILEPVSSKDYRGRSLWDYCSVAGFGVAILDYPMLYPAYPVNGVMVSSWGGKVTVHPESAAGIVDEVSGGSYDIFVDYHREEYNDIELFLEDLGRAVEKKLRVSRCFMKMRWNLFVDVLSFTDWLQHRMWHYIDPEHPLHPGGAESSRYVRRFAELWQMVDEYLGEVRETYDHVLVISDHGFGPQVGVFNLAKWLEKHGYVRMSGRAKRRLKEVLIVLARKARINKLIPANVRRKARSHGLSLASPALRYDLRESTVVLLDYTIPFGAIHVNPRVRDKEEVLERLERELSKLGEELGREVKVSTWRVEELYHGDKLSLLPDLIFAVNNWSCVVVKDPDKDFIYVEEPYSPRHTGSHRLYGIFVAWGTSFRKGFRIEEVSVYDIAPTVLHLLGLPVPSNMDGRVLVEAFEPGSDPAKRPPKVVEPSYYAKLKLAKKARRALRKTAGN